MKSQLKPIPVENTDELDLKINVFSQDSTPVNTERAFISDIDSYLNWGGKLPASPECISRYIVAHAHVHNVRTLRRRKAMLSKWHRINEVDDPTVHELVRKTVKGVSRTYNKPLKKKKPLSIAQLSKINNYLLNTIENAELNSPTRIKALRDRAMITTGFWGCLRSDELVNIRRDHLRIERTLISIFNPHNKTDREGVGREIKLRSLPKLCPVDAMRCYLKEAQPYPDLFPSMRPSGVLSNQAIKSKSILDWLVNLCKKSRVRHKDIGSHSLRRGFATWYAQTGDVWGLMVAGNWKQYDTAAGYVDGEVNIKLIRKRLKNTRL